MSNTFFLLYKKEFDISLLLVLIIILEGINITFIKNELKLTLPQKFPYNFLTTLLLNFNASNMAHPVGST